MHVLLIYSSNKGFTGECMQQIASRLTQQPQAKVTRVNLKKQPAPESLHAFDKILVASPLYAGRAHKRIRKFLHQNQQELLRFPLFLCLTGMMEAQIEQNTELNFPEVLRTHATAVEWLGGRLNLKDHNPFVRMMLKKPGMQQDEAMPGPEALNRVVNLLSA